MKQSTPYKKKDISMHEQIDPFDLIVITGPTATGKTGLAAHLAKRTDAQIISADSRQVYKGMDIGTGKDKIDYTVDGEKIDVHLIDIVDPGYEFNLFEYQERFFEVFESIRKMGKKSVLCGGTGLYIEAALARYKLLKVPENKQLRKQLEEYSWEELEQKLAKLKKLHNSTDTTERKRLIRAIEIETYHQEKPEKIKTFPAFNYLIFGVDVPRQMVREKITNRLKNRLEHGMIEEVEKLLKNGLKPDQLIFYGLEYKFITEYLTGELTYQEMFQKLQTAIHQFAKRQMTWFRRMEKKGFKIHWIDGTKDYKTNLDIILETIRSHSILPNK